MKRPFIKITVIAIISLLVSGGLFAQHDHELSVWGGGGLSGLNYKPTFGDKKLRLGGHFGLGYHYFFSPKWGLGTGAELGFYNTRFNMNNLENRYMVTDYQGIDFEFRSTITDYKEKQRAMMLQIPLMLQFQTPIAESNHQFFAAVGGKAGIPLRGKYDNTASFSNAGYYEYENALYNTQRFRGFGEFPDRKTKGDLDFKTAFFLSVEAGVKWRLHENWSLYTGVYMDYGLNNIVKTQILLPIVEYNNANPREFTANSIVQSQYTQYMPQQDITAPPQTFTDKITPIAIGIKLRLTFGKNCKQKEEPIDEIIPEPEPEPVHMATVTGKILDDASNEIPIGAKIEIIDNDTQEIVQVAMSDSLTGEYKVILPSGKNYGMIVTAPDYLVHSENFDVPDVINYQEVPKDVMLHKPEPEPEPEPEPVHVAIVTGKILDDASKIPIGAKIEIIDNDTQEVVQVVMSDPETGNYRLILPSGKNYGMMVTAPDYLFHSENFNIPDAIGRQEITKDIMLHKIEAGTRVVLNNIFFDFNRATLQQSSYPELNNVLKLMNEYPTLVIEISGHTDNVGSAAVNQRLSENRAKAVVDYLVAQGISATRLKYAGYGFTQPIADNRTDEGRAINRRVEFKILEK